ncbi:hypothetical protein I4U23_024334 [Adineta vaga]|nr:hypothetical protein I4U23_024334 [Adineta vaga]
MVGMDSHTVAQLTHILSEEAQMISDELKNNAQNINPDMIAAKLDGLVLRMKQELRNKGPDSSSYEFPIYQSSDHSSSVHPDPNNYLYDKRYNEAAYPSVRHTQSKLSYLDSKPKSLTKAKSIASSLSSDSQRHKTVDDWRFLGPYATYHNISRKSIDENSSLVSDPIRRSSTDTKSRSYSISHATTNQDSKHSSNSKAHKIVVTVINDRSSSKKATISDKQETEPIRTKSQKSILKTNHSEKTKGNVTLNTIRTIRNTSTGIETIENIFEDMTDDNKPRRSQTRSKRDHVTIVDRRDSKSSERKHSKSRKDRLRPSKTHSATSSIVPDTSLSRYVMQPPPYFSPPPSVVYPEQKPYPNMLRFTYPITSQFSSANTFYPFIYYQY